METGRKELCVKPRERLAGMRKSSVPKVDIEGIRNRAEPETTLNLADGARLPWGSGIAMMERIM